MIKVGIFPAIPEMGRFDRQIYIGVSRAMGGNFLGSFSCGYGVKGVIEDRMSNGDGLIRIGIIAKTGEAMDGCSFVGDAEGREINAGRGVVGGRDVEFIQDEKMDIAI